MDDITRQQTQTRLQTLPALLRDTLADPETYDKIALVGKKYDLTRVETGLLAQATGTLMMGFTEPKEFIPMIMDYLTIPRDKAVLIAQDLNRDIFNAVKEPLEKIHHIKAKTVTASVSEYARAHPAPGLTFTPTATPSFGQGIKPISIMSVMPTTPTEKGLPSDILGTTKVAAPSKGVAPAAGAPVVKPTATPPPTPAAKTTTPQQIRSEWGWHGRKNEVTGKIEFKHESARPDILAQAQSTPEGTPAGAAHVGSIFEQKLGGTFGVKGDTKQYEGSSFPAATPTSGPVAPTSVAAQNSPKENPSTTTELSTGHGKLPAGQALRGAAGQTVARPPELPTISSVERSKQGGLPAATTAAQAGAPAGSPASSQQAGLPERLTLDLARAGIEITSAEKTASSAVKPGAQTIKPASSTSTTPAQAIISAASGPATPVRSIPVPKRPTMPVPMKPKQGEKTKS